MQSLLLSAIFRHSLAPAVAGAGPRFCYPAAKRFSRLSASPFRCRRRYGRRFRLLPGCLLLIALIASAFGLDFCSGSSRHSSPTEQALPECDQRYRLLQQVRCHAALTLCPVGVYAKPPGLESGDSLLNR